MEVRVQVSPGAPILTMESIMAQLKTETRLTILYANLNEAGMIVYETDLTENEVIDRLKDIATEFDLYYDDRFNIDDYAYVYNGHSRVMFEKVCSFHRIH